MSKIGSDINNINSSMAFTLVLSDSNGIIQLLTNLNKRFRDKLNINGLINILFFQFFDD